ncbi:MAG: DNA polymerase III subunit delta [Dethiobacter sp.]|jgi:DNA polymerase-3 subunit delta|nr:DNA polymerase III subunit delta [Dethiobacter sp.]MCL4464273.1 DNA polymerase III subunit delta [Bacillota bacterium]MCL5993291.1 DNA polymerase III subunit delta [Bacillota bacterium]
MSAYHKEPDFARLKREKATGLVRAAYIFTGSEDFLMEEAVQLVRKLMESKNGTVDVTHLDGGACSLSHVLDLVDTVSLFGASRFVVVSDAPYFAKDAGDQDAIDRFLASHARQDTSSCLVICARDFLKTTKIAKVLTADGSLYLYEPLKTAALYGWVRERIAAAGKTVDKPTLDLLIERVGRDLRRLASELEKLFTYLGNNQELDENSVMLATSRSLQGDIFALTDAAVLGRTPKALFLLKDLLSSGEPPLRILAMLVRQFRMLGQAHELLKNGRGAGDLASQLGIHPYAAEKLASQAAYANDAMLCRAVELLLQTDLDIKRGKVDQLLALETLLVALGEKSA